MTRIEGEEAAFPDESVAAMRAALTELAMKSKELTFRLLRAIALSLNQPMDFFVKCHDKIFTRDNTTKLRSIWYPAIDGSVGSKVVRCGEHSGTTKHTQLGCLNI